MSRALPRWALASLLSALGLATFAALAAGAGDPFVAAAPVLAAAVVLVATRVPLRHTLAVVFLAVLVLDNPQERPAAGLWRSPLYPLGSLLFENLNKHTGVDGLRFALIDVILVGLVALAVLRGPGGSQPAPLGADHEGAVPRPPTVFTGALVLALAGLALAVAWGALRGGDLKATLWQIRQLAAYPVLALLFLSAFRRPGEISSLFRLVIAAAFFRALEGLYVYEVVCRPLNLRPPYVTSHSDTMLFTLAIMLLAIFWHETRGRKSFWAMVLGGLVLLGAIYMNGRRLAYVTLAASMLAVFLLAPRTRIKRALARAAVLSLPLALLYLAAGWNSTAKVFRPAQTAKSVLVSGSDRSTQTRDIENYNLVTTLKTNPLLGTGFGHEYLEVSRADDISQYFPQYRLIPHNSLLGLWAFAGLLGFWLAWLPIVVAVFLAVRAYSAAAEPVVRTLALSAVVMAIAYSLQAYGDMGMQSWGGAFLLAASLSASARLAGATGGWPSQHPLAEGIQPSCFPPPSTSCSPSRRSRSSSPPATSSS